MVEGPEEKASRPLSWLKEESRELLDSVKLMERSGLKGSCCCLVREAWLHMLSGQNVLLSSPLLTCSVSVGEEEVGGMKKETERFNRLAPETFVGACSDVRASSRARFSKFCYERRIISEHSREIKSSNIALETAENRLTIPEVHFHRHNLLRVSQQNYILTLMVMNIRHCYICYNQHFWHVYLIKIHFKNLFILIIVHLFFIHKLPSNFYYDFLSTILLYKI